MASKADARIGLLFSKLGLQKMPIEVLLKVFSCYILPIFEYGQVIWISGNYTSATEKSIKYQNA